jgi:hypothetical protein
VGDYRDAGVPRSVAMKLSGHKTENVYRRYVIVSESDLAARVQKIAALGGETGLAPRKVVNISEPISARTSTELTHSAEIEGSTPGRSRGQVLGNSAANRFAEASKGWRPQRDSNAGSHANLRRNPSANHGKTRTCARGQTTGTDGSRRSTGTVRGQLRDSSALADQSTRRSQYCSNATLPRCHLQLGG